MTTVRQPTKRRRSCVLTLKYTFICVYWGTRQRIHNTLIVVDRCLRLMGDKTIPDSAEPRLESFYPPFVAGIDLPHQGVVDSYNLHNRISFTGKMTSLYWIRAVMTSQSIINDMTKHYAIQQLWCEHTNVISNSLCTNFIHSQSWSMQSIIVSSHLSNNSFCKCPLSNSKLLFFCIHTYIT